MQVASQFVTDRDAEVGEWLFKKANAKPRSFKRAIGIRSRCGELAGGFLFTGSDGNRLEAHFWGPGALRAGVVRKLFAVALEEFDASAVIVRASKAHMARGCRKLGASLIRENHEHGEFEFSRSLVERLSGAKEK